MSQKVILSLILISLLQTTHAEGLQAIDEFKSWQQTHSKIYNSEEEQNYRFSVFQTNKAEADAHNAAGIHKYKKGLNHFSDLTIEEFQSSVLMKNYVVEDFPNLTKLEVKLDTPSSVDWRQTKGAVTVVKDQGQCGGCWSFATTGGMEGINGIQTGVSKSYSEQQLISCDTTRNKGCQGGSPYHAYQYISKNGLQQEGTYCYTSAEGTAGTCKYDSSQATDGKNIKTNVAQHDCSTLLQSTAVGPVSVAVDASAWQSYTSGIYDASQCGEKLDHGVLVVGYGTSGDSDYWIIKNSWTSSWGEDGYMKLERGTGSIDGACGVCKQYFWPSDYVDSGSEANPETWCSSLRLMSYLIFVYFIIMTVF